MQLHPGPVNICPLQDFYELIQVVIFQRMGPIV